MKTVSYSGPSISLGRFGTIDNGAVLHVTESEYNGIQDDARFTAMSRIRAATDALPLGTPLFDLRRIDWSRKGLQTELVKRGKPTLKNIAEAINLVGGELVVTEHDNTDIIADAIFAESRHFGWDKIEKATLLALGTTDVKIEAKAAKPTPVAPPAEAEEPAQSEEAEDETATAKRRRR